MTKKFVLTAVVLLLIAAGTVMAGNDSPINPLGRPAFSSAQIPHYIIWQDFNGWHVRWITLDSKHRFTGELRLKDGEFLQVKSLYPYLSKKTFKSDKQKITFDVTDDKKMNGIDFITHAKSIKFVLAIDGKQSKESIFIGAQSRHPGGVPFQLKPIQYGLQTN